MRSWGRSARGGGAAARNAPPGLAPRPPAALRRCALSARSSLPVPGVARGPPSARAPPSPSARGLSLLRVVTKHYKKAGRAVPGIGGGGARRPRIYPRARPPPRLRLQLPAPPPPPPLRPARRPPTQLAPRPFASPPAGRSGGAQGAGRAPRRSPRDARARAPLWTSRLPTSGCSAGHRWPPSRRLAWGTVGGTAPRPGTSLWDPVRRRGAARRGWPSQVPGAFPGFPSPSRVIPGREGTR